MTVTNVHDASPAKFVFCSSLADDVWQQSTAAASYEWWYFDAISDDGRDALVVIFLDNFIFSPRYNAAARAAAADKAKWQKEDAETRRRGDAEKRRSNEQTSRDGTNVSASSPLLPVSASPRLRVSASPQRFPAVAFCLYRDGKPIYRAINEFAPADFSAGVDFPSCRIGASDFQFEATPYGVRYILNVNANLFGGKRLHAALEWLAVERDFQPLSAARDLKNSHFWNLAVPRADVTGKIEVFNRSDKQLDAIQFRGTGYHDHNQDQRWLPAAVNEWSWGRAHFADATAIFYGYQEPDQDQPTTKLYLVCNNKLEVLDAAVLFGANKIRRDRFGLKYPAQLEFQARENTGKRLVVEQNQAIDQSFFYLRFLSRMRLDLGDARARETIGITEYLQPRSLRWQKLDWLVNMRIGRNGRGAFLP